MAIIFAIISRCLRWTSIPCLLVILFLRHNNIDVIIVREQTEGEYTSLEHEVRHIWFRVCNVANYDEMVNIFILHVSTITVLWSHLQEKD